MDLTYLDISVDEIQNRLQKLCASEPTVTMEELEYRLAKLKGSRPPAIRVHSIRVSVMEKLLIKVGEDPRIWET